MNKIITGIGARATPQPILEKFFDLGAFFAKKGWTLRSGGANGADKYWETGFDQELGKTEIYLPWKGFNDNHSPLFNIPIGAKLIASKRYKKWDESKSSVQNLMSRNVMQILGMDLNTPSDLVVCWTEGGKDIGGTSFAVKLARELNIPVFNFGGNGEEELKKWWKSL